MSNLIPHPTALAPDDGADLITPDPDEPNGLRWTPAKMAAFLRHLSAMHSVSEAARAVGMSRQSAYKLRARLKGQPFDVAWQSLTRRHFDALTQVALERAINGVEVPHFHKGELIHTSRRYDERLTVSLLAMRDRLAPFPQVRGVSPEHTRPDDLDDLLFLVDAGCEHWPAPELLDDLIADDLDEAGGEDTRFE
jgi:hypothetical protein